MLKQRRAFRIETAGEKIERDATAVLAQHCWIADTGERMIIGDKIKCFALRLQRNRGPHHAEVIADVQHAAGLDA